MSQHDIMHIEQNRSKCYALDTFNKMTTVQIIYGTQQHISNEEFVQFLAFAKHNNNNSNSVVIVFWQCTDA